MPYRHIQQQVKEIALNLEDRGMPCQEISDLLVVSERSMRRWRRNIHQYQSVIPPPLAPQGRPRSIPHEILDALHILLSAEPSSYLQEMQKWLTVEHDIAVSLSTIQRSLNAYGLTHKALSTLARERDDNKRAEWMEFVSSNFYDFQIICTDESYKDARTHSRRFGWSLRGNDAFELTPFVRGDRFSILPALTVDGFIALTVIEGSVDSEAFFQFIIDEVVSPGISCSISTILICPADHSDEPVA
jgi:transposase